MSIKNLKEELIISYFSYIFGKGRCSHCLKKHIPYSLHCSCNKHSHIAGCLYKAAEETLNEKFVTKIFMLTQTNIVKVREKCESLAKIAANGARSIAIMKKLDKNPLHWDMGDATEVVYRGAQSVSHLLSGNKFKTLR